MILSDIAKIRLYSQNISHKKYGIAEKIIEEMVAVQAQDFPMSLHALGLRLQKTNYQKIESVVNNGKILRTHLLRPTWHLVSNKDIYSLLQISSDRIKRSAALRNKQLGLTENIFSKCNKILEKALSVNENVTRDELIDLFAKNKIRTNENRLSHIMMNAEMEMIVCSGRIKKGKPSYTLFDKIITAKIDLPKDEIIAELAIRYFKSRCPATLQDFTWWSGLTASEARNGFENVKHRFAQETIEGNTYLIDKSFTMPALTQKTIYLLPAYDEYLISYKDRRAVLKEQNNSRAVSNNGLFRPIIIINGEVTGVWNRKTDTDKIIIDIELFDKVNKKIKNEIENSVNQFERFYEKNTEIKVSRL